MLPHSAVVVHAFVGRLQLSASGSEMRTYTTASTTRRGGTTVTGGRRPRRVFTPCRNTSSEDHWTSTSATPSLVTRRAVAFSRATEGRSGGSFLTRTDALVKLVTEAPRTTVTRRW